MIYTYFAQGVEDGPIKIGRSKDPQKRIEQFNVPWRMRLIYVLEGNLEHLIHSAFDDLRMEGEWFRPGPALLRLLDRFRKWDTENL